MEIELLARVQSATKDLVSFARNEYEPARQIIARLGDTHSAVREYSAAWDALHRHEYQAKGRS